MTSLSQSRGRSEAVGPTPRMPFPRPYREAPDWRLRGALASTSTNGARAHTTTTILPIFGGGASHFRLPSAEMRMHWGPGACARRLGPGGPPLDVPPPKRLGCFSRGQRLRRIWGWTCRLYSRATRGCGQLEAKSLFNHSGTGWWTPPRAAVSWRRGAMMGGVAGVRGWGGPGEAGGGSSGRAA